MQGCNKPLNLLKLTLEEGGRQRRRVESHSGKFEICANKDAGGVFVFVILNGCPYFFYISFGSINSIIIYITDSIHKIN